MGESREIARTRLRSEFFIAYSLRLQKTGDTRNKPPGRESLFGVLKDNADARYSAALTAVANGVVALPMSLLN
jgi:hypothetical protein